MTQAERNAERALLLAAMTKFVDGATFANTIEDTRDGWIVRALRFSLEEDKQP